MARVKEVLGADLIDSEATRSYDEKAPPRHPPHNLCITNEGVGGAGAGGTSRYCEPIEIESDLLH